MSLYMTTWKPWQLKLRGTDAQGIAKGESNQSALTDRPSCDAVMIMYIVLVWPYSKTCILCQS